MKLIINEENIILDIANYHMCNNIWDMSKKKELATKFYEELKSGNRITFIYIKNNEYLGEVSLVFDRNDPDYTIEKKRIYLYIPSEIEKLEKVKVKTKNNNVNIFRTSIWKIENNKYKIIFHQASLYLEDIELNNY